MHAIELRASINGCPGEESLAWLVSLGLLDADITADEAIDEHCAFLPGIDGGERITQFHERITAAGGVTDVLGWRTRHLSQRPVVTVACRDGRVYDLVVSVDDDTQRLTDFRFLRSLGDIEVAWGAPADLTAVERDEICSLFERSYGNADLDHVRRQLDQMTDVLVARDGDRLVQFGLARTAILLLPVVGPTAIGSAGMFCVDPEYRRRGLSDGASAVAQLGVVPDAPPAMIIFHFATPITAHEALQFLRPEWPGTNVEAMEAAYANPTTTQRAVGRFLADDAGAVDYDDDHWVIVGSGRAAGEGAAADGLDAAYGRLFAHVDRDRGDTLLGPFWLAKPPDEWFV